MSVESWKTSQMSHNREVLVEQQLRWPERITPAAVLQLPPPAVALTALD